MTGPPLAPRPIVPAAFLGGFADAAGQLMAERRDRTRRRLVPVEAVLAELGTYTLPAGRATSAGLARVLADAEGRAADAVARMTAGAFPLPVSERAALALVVAVQLVLGRHHRAAVRRAAKLVGQLIVSTIEETEAAHGDGPDEPERGEEESAAEDPEAGGAEPEGAVPPGAVPGRAAEAEPGGVDVLVRGRGARPHTIEPALPLARQIAGRTWQLVRFPTPVLLTSDTPVVLWAPSVAARPYQVGLAAADELRLPLDPRHALIIARRARAGEVVRDLDERHARALNRTVAESAVEWMYYHPGSDPLERVELASPDAG